MQDLFYDVSERAPHLRKVKQWEIGLDSTRHRFKGSKQHQRGRTDAEAFSMEFNGTEFVQSSEVVPGIDPADGAGTGAHS